jgi:hypothetical protein
MTHRIAVILVALCSLATASEASVQVADSFASVHIAAAAASRDAQRPTLREASRQPVLTASVPTRPQSTARERKGRAMQWGAAIGVAAGVTGGLLQPTHSNGEYVLGNSRAVSALVLGGIGAGLGAVIGLAIDNARH